jgi:hypothetical protein
MREIHLWGPNFYRNLVELVGQILEWVKLCNDKEVCNNMKG